MCKGKDTKTEGVKRESKTCTQCGEVKSLSQFTKLKHGRNGRRAQCRACDKAYRKANPRPRKVEEYELCPEVIQDHFHLHFGFKERTYKPSEWSEAAKYTMEPIKIKNNLSDTL